MNPVTAKDIPNFNKFFHSFLMAIYIKKERRMGRKYAFVKIAIAIKIPDVRIFLSCKKRKLNTANRQAVKIPV